MMKVCIQRNELCVLGKGTMFTASFLRSAFNCPGNLRQVVTPDIVADTR